MSDDYCCGNQRKKKKDKFKDKKKHPYKLGGVHRSDNLSKKKCFYK